MQAGYGCRKQTCANSPSRLDRIRTAGPSCGPSFWAVLALAASSRASSFAKDLSSTVAAFRDPLQARSTEHQSNWVSTAAHGKGGSGNQKDGKSFLPV